MGKYTPLREFLLKQGKERIAMTFAEIEAVLNAPLPASKRYPAWWSNNAFNNTMTSEWLAAGYQTEAVDVAEERLVFKQSPMAATAKAGNGKKKWEDVFGFMKGKMTLADGYDPASPLDVEWGEPYLGMDETGK